MNRSFHVIAQTDALLAHCTGEPADVTGCFISLETHMTFELYRRRGLANLFIEWQGTEYRSLDPEVNAHLLAGTRIPCRGACGKHMKVPKKSEMTSYVDRAKAFLEEKATKYLATTPTAPVANNAIVILYRPNEFVGRKMEVVMTETQKRGLLNNLRGCRYMAYNKYVRWHAYKGKDTAGKHNGRGLAASAKFTGLLYANNLRLSLAYAFMEDLQLTSLEEVLSLACLVTPTCGNYRF